MRLRVVNGFTSGVSLDSGRGKSASSVLIWSYLDDSSMDATTDAVLHFDVEFGDDVCFESLVFFEILLGGGVDNISDVESFNGLVFGAETTAVHTHDGLYVASVLFVTTVVSPLDRHVVNSQLNNISPLIKILNISKTAITRVTIHDDFHLKTTLYIHSLFPPKDFSLNLSWVFIRTCFCQSDCKYHNDCTKKILCIYRSWLRSILDNLAVGEIFDMF